MTVRHSSADSVRTGKAPLIDFSGIAKPPAWMAEALCAQIGGDLFFPEKGGSTREAKSVCAACPVQRQCLEYALEYESGAFGTAQSYPAGIYGGLTERERHSLLSLPVEEQEQIRAGHLPTTRALATATAARQQVRLRQAGRAIGRPKGATTKPYFGDTHPLAKVVRARCDHRGRPKVGGVGCGECWEASIRDDQEQAVAS